MDSNDPSVAPPSDQPPPYVPSPWNNSEGGNGPPQSGLDFVDFLPAVVRRAQCCVPPTYEKFSTLIERANKWLQENRQWKVFTCESVEFTCRSYYADSRKMTYDVYDRDPNFYVRGIRLFLRERTDVSESVQQIGYLNLCPMTTRSPGFLRHAKYETLDDVIENYNLCMRGGANPAFQGRIITIETQNMHQACNFNPEKSNWIEQGKFAGRFVFILRIFYEVMPLEPEEIGIQDFVPYETSAGTFLSPREFEPFTNVLNRASSWCSQQQGIRICNVQTLEMKVKGDGVNTIKTDYLDMGFMCLVRILRVAYTRPSADSYSSYGMPSSVSALTCKSFIPVQLTRGCVTYESLYQTKERVSAWVKATGARVINAETSKFRVRKLKKRPQLTEEDSYTLYSSDQDETWIYVIRLYLDGVYQEPPPHMLPQIPCITEEYCCTLL